MRTSAGSISIPCYACANGSRSIHTTVRCAKQIGKKEALLKFPQICRGESIQRLLNATSFDYYNPGASRD